MHKNILVPGQRFGLLTLTQVLPIPKGKRVRFCTFQCTCGRTINVNAYNVIRGFRKSCGCVWQRKFCQGIPISFFSKIKRHALERNLEFSITQEFVGKLFEKQCQRCALSGLKLQFIRNQTTASLDRIDSTKGYAQTNVQWVHKHVNIMKLNLDQDYFLKLVSAIAQFSVVNTSLA